MRMKVVLVKCLAPAMTYLPTRWVAECNEAIWVSLFLFHEIQFTSMVAITLWLGRLGTDMLVHQDLMFLSQAEGHKSKGSQPIQTLTILHILGVKRQPKKRCTTISFALLQRGQSRHLFQSLLTGWSMVHIIFCQPAKKKKTQHIQRKQKMWPLEVPSKQT